MLPQCILVFMYLRAWSLLAFRLMLDVLLALHLHVFVILVGHHPGDLLVSVCVCFLILGVIYIVSGI